jgi:hypothetical protein
MQQALLGRSGLSLRLSGGSGLPGFLPALNRFGPLSFIQTPQSRVENSILNFSGAQACGLVTQGGVWNKEYVFPPLLDKFH